MSVAAVPFRFDAAQHEYLDLETGAVYPHITGILESSGWVDSTWYTEASSVRGQQVHQLCSDFDLGALTLEQAADYRHVAYLHAYAKALSILKPTILAVEEPHVHPVYRFGGRPDRHVVLYGLQAVLEIKSGLPHKAHPLQTALQSILLAPSIGLPEHAIARFALYLTARGRFRLERHERRGDFDEAHRIVRSCCGAPQ